jgi:hypothetical protein
VAVGRQFHPSQLKERCFVRFDLDPVAVMEDSKSDDANSPATHLHAGWNNPANAGLRPEQPDAGDGVARRILLRLRQILSPQKQMLAFFRKRDMPIAEFETGPRTFRFDHELKTPRITYAKGRFSLLGAASRYQW